MELRVYHIRREQLRNKGEFILKFNITLLTWQNQQIKKLRNREIKFSCVYVFLLMYFYFQKKKILVLFSAVRMNTKKKSFETFYSRNKYFAYNSFIFFDIFTILPNYRHVNIREMYEISIVSTWIKLCAKCVKIIIGFIRN